MTYQAHAKSSLPSSEIYHAKRRIDSAGLKWLFEQGELQRRDRIAECRDGLLEQGLVTQHPDIETDLALLMGYLRQRPKAHFKSQRQREKNLEKKVLHKLGIASKAAFNRTSERELIEKARSLESYEYKRAFENMFEARANAIETHDLKSEWYENLTSAHVRNGYHATDKRLWRILRKRLVSIGPAGQLASMCLKIQKHANQLRGNVALNYSNYRYREFSNVLEQLARHLANHDHLVKDWGVSKEYQPSKRARKNIKDLQVFCLDLPSGQVQWHYRGILESQTYLGNFLGENNSEDVILQYAESVLPPALVITEDPLRASGKSIKAKSLGS